MTARATLCLLLVLAACQRPPSVEDPLAAGSGQEPAPADEAPGATAEPAEGSAQPPALSWGRCHNGEDEAVRAAPVVVDGAISTIGEQLDANALSRAYPFLGDSNFVGRWECRESGGAVEVRYRALLGTVPVGPTWRFESLDAAPDGRPPRPEPLDLPAMAVEARWQAEPGVFDEALASMARCTAPNGRWVTSGILAELMSDDDVEVDPDSLSWLVLPRVREQGRDRFELTFSWAWAGEARSATWFVTPGEDACEPRDEGARRIVGFADGIPAQPAARIRPPNLRPSDAPFEERDPGRRAMLYVAAERRELGAVEDWASFIDRHAPFGPGDWVVRTGPAQGRFEVEYAFGTGDERRELAWAVDANTGEVEPTTRLARLARAVQPRRLPGVEAPERLPHTLHPERIDAAIRPRLQPVAACLRDATVRAITLSWSVQWDGHAFGFEIDGVAPDSRLGRCVLDAVQGWRFDRFAGPPTRSSTVVELD